MWLAFSRIRADRELACDAIALSHANEGENKSYGQAIIKLLEDFTPPAPVAGLVGILEDKRQIKRRIAMIAEFKNESQYSGLAPVLALAITLVSLTDAQTVDINNAAQVASPSKGSAVTLRRLPDFRSRLRDICDPGRARLAQCMAAVVLGA